MGRRRTRFLVHIEGSAQAAFPGRGNTGIGCGGRGGPQVGCIDLVGGEVDGDGWSDAEGEFAGFDDGG